VKDIIIRGGENIVGVWFIILLFYSSNRNATIQDSVSVENAFYADPRILEVAAVGVPDERWGETVAAIVSLRHDCVLEHKGLNVPELEESLIGQVRTR
jgi:acyl-CoA synthetase (AMP-forming)/AMP-acid ligase II